MLFSSLFYSDSTSNRLTLRVSDFTLKCIAVFVVYLNTIERSNQVAGELLTDSGESLLIRLASAWQFQDLRLLSWETDLGSRNN